MNFRTNNDAMIKNGQFVWSCLGVTGGGHETKVEFGVALVPGQASEMGMGACPGPNVP